ncbi:MAG: SIMPL domain-containing protein [Pseudomonadota bacterium]
MILNASSHRAALLIGLLAAPLIAQPATAQGIAGSERRITVLGEGVVEAVPDLAIITMGVITQADTAGAALRQNSSAMTDVLATLEAAAIEARDIATASVTLGPLYGREPDAMGRRQIVGYTASNTVTVRVRALDTLGETLDAVTAAGATTLEGIRFSLSEPEALLDEARRKAIAEARRRATLYAEAAGASLGGVLQIDEGGAGASPAPVARMALAEQATAVPIARGERALRVTVRVVFALE